MKKNLYRYLMILILGPVIGVVLLWLVYLLPTDNMKKNVYSSKEMIEKEFVDETIIDGFNATLTGSFTDCLMLEHAVYTGNHSKFEQIMRMYRAESFYDENDESAWHPGESLIDYLEGIGQEREVEYARYWHGYLVALKPLLLVTSVASLRLLNGGLELLLVGMCIIFLERKQRKGMTIPFLASIPFLYFVSTFSSFSQSICMYLMLSFILIQLKHEEILEKNHNYILFFLISGMVTSYFDFLTYPLVTLGYPLVIYFYKNGDSVRSDLKRMVTFSFNWFWGYVWMWFSKWVLAAVFTGSNTLKDAFMTLQTRTGNAGSEGRIGGFIKVIHKNLDAYLNWGFLLFMMVILIMLLSKNLFDLKICKFKKTVPFLLVALYPFGWWFVTQNHSDEHWMFTCRIFAISVFALLSGVVKAVERNE